MRFNRSIVSIVAVLGLATIIALPSSGQVVTFGSGNLGQLASAGAQVEAGFSYSATGAGWEIQNTFAIDRARLQPSLMTIPPAPETQSILRRWAGVLCVYLA